MTIATLLYFLGASVALTLAPGPDNIFIMTQGVARGRKPAIITALGSGISVHTTAAAFGISALFYSCHCLQCRQVRRSSVFTVPGLQDVEGSNHDNTFARRWQACSSPVQAGIHHKRAQSESRYVLSGVSAPIRHTQYRLLPSSDAVAGVSFHGAGSHHFLSDRLFFGHHRQRHPGQAKDC